MRTMKFGSTRDARRGAALALAILTAACGEDLSESMTESPSQTPLGPPSMTDAGSQLPGNPPQGSDGGQTPSGTMGGPMTGGGTSDAGIVGGGSRDGGTLGGGVSDGGSRDGGTSDSGMTGGGTSDGGMTGGGTNPPMETPVCEAVDASKFQPNASVGGGGSQYKESDHFRIYGASGTQADEAIKQLEAAYSCFIESLCWRSSGLSIRSTSDTGPYHKMNIYVVGSLGGAAGQMFSDASAGLSYLKVGSPYVADPKVIVHEYGHALTYHEKGWVDQTRTGAWWETVANFVADTYMTSPLCEKARSRFQVGEGRTIIDLNKVIGSSHQVIVDGSQGSGNYYQAWPFLTYLTNNPDGYPGLGPTALREMFRKHMRNNETPLHVLERVAAPVKAQTVVGRYWARMAYLDIGHKQAQAAFMSGRSRLNFANLDSMGSGAYRVKSARQPRYMGSNIIPLTGNGNISVKVTSSAPFTATLAVRSSSGAVRYVDLKDGAGEAMVQSGEEASLVVVNTPATLYLYDPFSISGDVARGLDYQVQITGATLAN